MSGFRLGSIFASVDRCESAQWERAGAGLSLRLGEWLFALGHIGYRDKGCAWPKWLRFGLSLHGPANMSMSRLPKYYLYLFGRRVFDTTYWDHAGSGILTAAIAWAAFAIVGGLALGVGGCQSNGTLTPSAQANVAAAYAAVCPPVLSGALDPFAGQFNARAQSAFASAKTICANGAPTNIVVAGLDILTVETALAPYLAKAK